jgi:hypothetical protein
MPVVLDVNIAEVDALARSVGAVESVVRKAMDAALRRTARHVFTHVRRSVGRAANAPQKALKDRLRMRVRRERGTAVIWVGLNPLNPVRVGARQTRRGVTARGGRRWDRAFIANGKNGRERVFRRTSKARLPLEAPMVSIEREVVAALQEADVPSATDFYFRTLRHELRRRVEGISG